MAEVKCPSCGGTTALKTRSALVVVCEYCQSTLLRTDLAIEDLGKMAQLADDASPVQLDARGTHRGRHFEVVGRIQLRYAAGFWNEWFVRFDDGTEGWLGEGSGNYSVTFLAKERETLPRQGTLRPGQSVTIGGKTYTVRDIETAQCVAGEGELPFRVDAGYSAPSADLAGEGLAFATIDWSEEPPLAFVGESVEFDDLAFQGLRTIAGW